MGKSSLIVGHKAAADYVGENVNTWKPYVSRGQAPQPVDYKIEAGHARPVWTREQLDEWMHSRPGKGAPGRPRARRRAA